MAIDMALKLGNGTELAKFDLKSAYHMVPIHCQDHHLLGVKWCNQVFLDSALQFGLCSALKIFSAVADALAWVMIKKGVQNLLHYVDNFLDMGRSESAK